VNQGAPVARNTGIRAARGEWLTFLDADDEWLPHIVEAHQRLMDRNPQLKWFFCNVRLLREGTGRAGGVPADLEAEATRTGCLDFFVAFERGVRFGVGGFFVHRSVFEEVGLFDPTLRRAQDRDMWWRIAMRHPLIGYSPEPGFVYHKDTPGSLTKGEPTRDLQLRNVLLNMQRARDLGPDVAARALPALRKLAKGYLMRGAAGLVQLSPELAAEALRVFPLRWQEHLQLRALSAARPALARKLLHRLLS
jgi:hypothetical protein